MYYYCTSALIVRFLLLQVLQLLVIQPHNTVGVDFASIYAEPTFDLKVIENLNVVRYLEYVSPKKNQIIAISSWKTCDVMENNEQANSKEKKKKVLSSTYETGMVTLRGAIN